MGADALDGLGLHAGLQALAVARGLRPAARLSAQASALPALLATLQTLGLEARVGGDTVASEPTPGRGGYGEWGRRRPARAADPDPVRHVYAARTRPAAAAARQADESGDDAAFGRALGYPPCCVAAFRRLDRRGDPLWAHDPVLQTYEAGAEAPWPMNVCLLHQGDCLLAHVPCAQDCPRTLDQALGLAALLRRTAPDRGRALAGTLRGAYLHTSFLGVARLDDAGGRIAAVVGREADAPGLLRPGLAVEAGEDGVVVGGMHLSRRHAAVFRFV